MNDYKKYWIWLSSLIGVSSRTDEILSAYPEPHKLFEASEKDRLLSGVFTPGQLEKLRKNDLSKALDALSACEKHGWQIVTPDDKIYPAGLRKIVDMPLVLYVDGDISCLRGKVMVGVVGTRKPCVESVEITRRICGDLASAGAVVVSGGALGIDSAAHEGTLNAGGKTVCVLGCGLGTKYLMDNEAMRRQISKNGAVVSEYAPFTSASRLTFPQRNRIISGMSHGVLVVEAGDKSGSLITAEYAAEQGREVFAIPGSVLSSAYSGANKLIRDGAKSVSCAEDILKPYSVIYPDRINLSAIGKASVPAKAKEEKKASPSGLDPDELAVYNLIGEKALDFNDICALSGFPAPKVIPILLKLELEDYIIENDEKNYTLK